jgi:hypothetical protein
VQIGEIVVVICSYELRALVHPVMNLKPVSITNMKAGKDSLRNVCNCLYNIFAGSLLRGYSIRDPEDAVCLGHTKPFHYYYYYYYYYYYLSSVASVLERTIPTERPPLVDEVSANFCG